MSLKAMVWALENDQVFSSAHKFVLVALANYADDNGRAWPQVSTICRLTQQSDDTVRRCLKRLQDDSVIEDTGKRFGPTQQVKVWQLPEQTWKVKDPHHAGLRNRVRPAEDPQKTRRRPAEDPQGAGQPLEPYNRTTKEPLTKETKAAPAGAVAVVRQAKKVDSIPFKDRGDFWLWVSRNEWLELFRRPGLYEELKASGWRTDTTGEPIRNIYAYCAGLNKTIIDASTQDGPF